MNLHDKPGCDILAGMKTRARWSANTHHNRGKCIAESTRDTDNCFQSLGLCFLANVCCCVHRIPTGIFSISARHFYSLWRLWITTSQRFGVLLQDPDYHWVISRRQGLRKGEKKDQVCYFIHEGSGVTGLIMEYKELVLAVVTIATAVTIETTNAQEGDYSGKLRLKHLAILK